MAGSKVLSFFALGGLNGQILEGFIYDLEVRIEEFYVFEE